MIQHASRVVAGLALLIPASAGQTPIGGGPLVQPSLVQVDAPLRIASAPTGELLVTDYELHRVCVVGPDGREILRSFPVSPQPTAIGVLGRRVFVGSESSGQIEVRNLKGVLKGTLGGPGFAVGDPRDLAIDAQLRRLFVVDGAAGEIKVFDLTSQLGQHVAAIGAPGTAWSEFQNPTGIALDRAAQEVLVGDFGSMSSSIPARIMVFGYDGTSRGWMTGSGGPNGQYFARPQGLMVGSSGHLFIVDSWRGEVVVMDRTVKSLIGVLGGYGKKPGQLLLPLDLTTLGPNEDLYVTSAGSHRVERFPAGGQL